MDAKAKVVRFCPHMDADGVYLGMDAVQVGAWVSYDDHEAAMAELTEENAASEAICWRKCEELDTRLQTLLTGLEALAGELKEDSEDKELSDVWRSTSTYYAHRVSLLLANSANGGE